MRRNQKHNRSRNSLIHLPADHGKAALLIAGGN
jgi:hypothetical protein